MHPNMQRLVELQGLDERLLKLRKDLSGVPARLAIIEARLKASKSILTSAQESRTTSLTERKKFEIDVEQWREKARKYRDQSYEVKTNEAFKALQHEITHAEKEMAQAEDRLLERMVSGEEYDRTIKSAEADLKLAETAAAAERAKLESERAKFSSELAAAETERANIITEIPETLLSEYDRIGARHHGIALAGVLHETCQACGVRIRPHVFQELRRATNDHIFTCETCNRILYYLEPSFATEGDRVVAVYAGDTPQPPAAGESAQPDDPSTKTSAASVVPSHDN
jgi:uncharacterized protein